MTPPKKGVSTNIGENFAETLQFEELRACGEKFLSFYYGHIFVKKILNWYPMYFLWMLKKKFKTFCGIFSVCSKGPPLSPYQCETTFSIAFPQGFWKLKKEIGVLEVGAKRHLNGMN